MSGLEVVGLAMAVIAAVRVLPEIPKVWRKAIGSGGSRQVERFSHREYRDSRTGQQMIIDRRVTQANNEVMVQATMKTIQDVSNNHAMVHMNSNQLQGIIWAHTTRTTDRFVEVIQDQFQQMHDDHVHVRTLVMYLMVIVGYFGYLLGASTGENNILHALLRTEGAKMPVIDRSSSIGLTQRLRELTVWLLSISGSLSSSIWFGFKSELEAWASLPSELESSTLLSRLSDPFWNLQEVIVCVLVFMACWLAAGSFLD